MSKTLILVRHGRIKANTDGVWHGWTDSPLTWTGRRQAKRTGRYFAKQPPFAAVYASPLERCQHTARLASASQELEVQAVDGLKEMGIGEWEGMPFKTLATEHNFFKNATEDLAYSAPGGESLTDVANRVTEALLNIQSHHGNDERVLVVSHGVALAVALATFLNQSPSHWRDYHFDNCSITELRLEPDPVVVKYNETAHL